MGNSKERSLVQEVTDDSKLVRRGQAVNSMLNAAIVDYRDTRSRRSEEVRKFDGMLPSVIYRGEPFISSWLIARKDYHTAQEARRKVIKESNPYLNAGLARVAVLPDMYGQRVRGVSLCEIEQMAPPLSLQEIYRINKLMTPSIFGDTKHGRDLSQALIHAATAQFVQPESAIVDRRIKPFVDVATSYFDYYTDLLISSDLEPKEEKDLVSILKSHRTLVEQMGIYLPAKLGITPSSAAKIMLQRGSNASDSALRCEWQKLATIFIEQSQQAYPNFESRPMLRDAMLHDRGQDDLATAEIAQAFGDLASLDGGELQGLELDGEEQLRRFVSTGRKELRRKIYQSDEREIYYALETPHFQGKLIVTEIYKNTAIFILHMQNGSRLLLEVNPQGSIFGFPPELERSYPHLGKIVLGEILENLQGKLPAVQKQEAKPDKEPKYDVLGRTVFSANEQPMPDKPVKRRRQQGVAFLGGLLHARSDTQEPSPLMQEKVRYVGHTEDSIKKMIGEKTPQEHIDLLLSAIRRFEFGVNNFEQMVLHKGRNLYRIRVGDFRIVVEKNEGNRFTIVDIGNRKEIYKRFDSQG